MKATLNPIENPRQKYMTPEEAWRQEVNTKLIAGRNPSNVPNVVSQRSLRIPNMKYMFVDSDRFAEYPIGGFDLNNIVFAGQLADIQDFRLDNVNGLLMNCNLNFGYFDNGFDLFDPAPTPSGNYSVYYYVTFWLGAFDIPWLAQPFERAKMTLEFRLNYNASTNLFAFAQSSRTFNILDTINPNATNPEKVRSTVVNQFLQTNTIQGQAGFDLGQIEPTAADTPNPNIGLANRNHFKYFWKIETDEFPVPDTYEKGRAFTIRPILTFNYSGTFAEFTPLTN